MKRSILRITLDPKLDPNILEKLKKPKMRLNERDCFDEAKCEIKTTATLITFTLRMNQEITFKPSLSEFPFDIQNIDMKFELTSQPGKEENGQGFNIRFNLHKSLFKDVMLRFKRPKSAEEGKKDDKKRDKKSSHPNDEKAKVNLDDDDSDGDDDNTAYDDESNPADDGTEELEFMPDLNIAFGLVTVPRTPPEIKSDNREVYFPQVKVRVPLFREPEYTLLYCLMPLLLLNLIALAVFRMDPADYSARVSCVTIILLGLFAFLPSYRHQIPAATFTSLDRAVFVTVGVLFLLLIDAFVAYVDEDHSSGPLHLVLFGISVALIAIFTIYIIIRYIRFRVGLHEMITPNDKLPKPSGGDFKPSEWNCAKIKIGQKSKHKPRAKARNWLVPPCFKKC
jgi:hypothetical protein